jgi:hypothetical protein
VPASAGLLDGRGGIRVAVDLPLEVYSSDFAGPLAGKTRDLGMGGVCAAVRSWLALGSIRKVSLLLPERPVTLGAEGRWQSAAGATEAGVLVGLRFSGTGADESTRLWNVIRDHSWHLASFLQGESDLRELPPDAAMAIATQSRLRAVKRGGAVYRQGDPANAGAIYVVLEGRVSLRHKVRFARELSTPELGPGSLIGGMGAIADLEVAETATAEADLRLLEIGRGSYEYLCLAQPLVAHRLARLVARRHAQVAQHFMRVLAAGC